MDRLAPYIGIPWHETRQDLGAASCWGLVRLFLLREARVATESYSETSAWDLLDVARRFQEAISSGVWRPVAGTPRVFDVASIWAKTRTGAGTFRLPTHCGVVCSPGRLLHVERASHSVHMPLAHPQLRSRIVAFYRHRDLPWE